MGRASGAGAGRPERPTTLAGRHVRLRPSGPEHRATLRAILSEPDVAQWWGTGGPDEAVDDLYAPDQVALVIEVEGEVIGSIQYAEETDPDYRHAGIDIFVATAWQGRGLGRDALVTLARFLFEERGHHRLTIDPAATNERAIGLYRSIGFRAVGIMRRYQRGPDGEWHDGLLLDMLAGELREPSQ